MIKLNRWGVSAGMLVAVLLTSACVGADTRADEKPGQGDRPAWLLNPPTKAGYLYGAGSAEIFAGEAEAMERARDQARLAIVRQFAEVEVSGELVSKENLSQHDGREVYRSEVENLARSRVKPIKLTHVSFTDHYRDGRWVHVLGELDVGREKMSLRRQRDELDQQLSETAQRLAKTTGRPDIHLIRELTPALVSMHERAELQSRLNALARGMGEPLNSDEQLNFRKQLLESIATLSVMVVSRGKRDAALQSGLSNRLTERGMRLDESGGDLRVFYDLDSTERARDGMVFVTTRGRVSIEDRHGREIASFRASAKGSSADADTARARSLDKLADRLGDQLIGTLLP